MFLGFRTPAHCLFQTRPPPPLSLTLKLHLSLSLSLRLLSTSLLPKKAFCWCTQTHVIDKCTISSKHAFCILPFIFGHVFLTLLMCSCCSSPLSFLLSSYYPSKFLLFCRIPEDLQSLSIAPLSVLRWRDVVTMECSVACQRRHSGWTEWSNRGTKRREEKKKVEKQEDAVFLHLGTFHFQYNKIVYQVY